MKIEVTTENVAGIKAPAVIFVTEEDVKSLKKKDKLHDLILPLVHAGEVKGEKDEMVLVHTQKVVDASHVILIGLGKEKDISVERLRRATALAVKKIKAMKQDVFAIEVNAVLKTEDAVHAIVESLLLTNYDFAKYKTEAKEKQKEIKQVYLSVKKTDFLKGIVAEAQIVCGATNMVRDLQNENADIVNSLYLEGVARDLAKKNGLKIKVFTEKEIEKMGMGLLMAVGKGSSYPQRFIILEYEGDKSAREKIALVGKGITFDSGGLNLKPTGFMETMKMDMSGVALILGTLKAASELKIRKNVIGVMPICENAIGSRSYKPGDVYISYSGKSVEIGNTDAEGRLILADALAYTEKNIKPTRIIDFATLTGAVMVTFGEFIAGMMGTDEKTMEKLKRAGDATYERVWELPVSEEFKDEVKSDIADVNNMNYGRNAGAIMGAAFLSKFVDKTPWIHLDIAGTAWWEKERYYTKKGGTGFGVRLMIEYLKNS